MAGVRVGAGGCGHRVVCVLVVAVGAAMVVVTDSAATGIAEVMAAGALLMGRVLAVAVYRSQPQDGCRHGGGQDGF